MAITTTCPSCNGPLRVPDELVGQRVRCPVCQTIFDAAASNGQQAALPDATEQAPASEQPVWKNLSLELDKGDPTEQPQPPAPKAPPPPPPPPSPRKPGLVGAVEVKSSVDDDGPAPRPGPAAGASAAPPAQRPNLSGPRPRDYPRDDDDDRPLRRGGYAGPPRRDSEPHRGVLILVLGVVSLVTVFLSFCYGLGTLVGIPLGITAWVLGHGDLRKIKNREMDEEGLGTTQAGWICGIIGVILHCLILLACGGIIAFFLIMGANSGASTKPGFGGP